MLSLCDKGQSKSGDRRKCGRNLSELGYFLDTNANFHHGKIYKVKLFNAKLSLVAFSVFFIHHILFRKYERVYFI